MKLRNAVLLILPLLTAVNSQAGTIANLPTGNPSCTGTMLGECSADVVAIAPVGGIAGVSLTTVDITGYNASPATLTLSASGALTGAAIPAGTTIPLFYDFYVYFAGSGSVVHDWTLDFTLLDGANVIGDSGPIAETGLDVTGYQPFSGGSSMTTTGVASVNDILTENATITVDWTEGRTGLKINVPAGSFDFNSTASAPEPGTWATTSLALLVGCLYWRRRGKTARVTDLGLSSNN